MSLRAFNEALQYLNATLETNMPIQRVQVFLAIGANPGITSPELQQQLNIRQQYVSRHIQALKPLVEPLLSADDPRCFAYRLTSKGKEVFTNIQQIVG